ncbi:hypothetical protein ILUMI_08211 [Ignelater luminosus]|uniref:NACHT domain-containing protein n=1 Tax=Ignelater luminosus TaxID=2038154 RepID=A0A8K0GFL7_IGNLU|nr:hypothetical protein ILUMI_08211 [Ignelater luminosus]
MHSSQLKYKVRSGTIDRGKEYESKILTLLALQCLHHSNEDFWLATNADGVGAFDDVILHYGKKTFMLQLKHKENPKPILEGEFLVSEKGEFSLKKYFKDISDLKTTLNSFNIKNKNPSVLTHLGNFENIYFLLYTNSSVNDYKFLNEICDINEFCYLNSSDNCKAFKFDLTQCCNNTNFNDESCFANFYLVSNQVHAKDVHKKIEETIKKIVDTNDAKMIGENLIKFITEWGKGNLGGHYFLTKKYIIWKLSELLFNEYEIKLLKEPYCYYDGEQKMLWNEIIKDKTVTLIDIKYDDKIAFKFILEYIGSEIKKYCNIEDVNWSHDLSQNNQNLFYDQNIDLKPQMLKIVGNHGKISINDIYKCLWHLNKLPLLLEINKKEQYDHINEILKLSNYCCKIIIINRSAEDITIAKMINHFKSLRDLDTNQRNAILKLEVKLQGRVGAKLKNLLDEHTLSYIKTVDVINIILNNFNVGKELDLLPNYYIKKGLQYKLIEFDAITDNHDEIFLIDDFGNYFENLAKQKNIKFMFLIEIKLKNLDECNVIINNEQEKEISRELFPPRKIIHHLIYHSTNCLQWKRSFGSIKSLRFYRTVFKTQLEEEIDFSSNITIISADPGMGKSVLMDFIAQKAPTDKWIIKINLNQHHDYYESDKCKSDETNTFKHLQYFSGKPCGNQLNDVILARLLESRNVIILLDGFDEISRWYKEKVTNIAKSFYNEGFHIWLTTRPLMKSYLEAEFNSFAMTLSPFNQNDQTQFLLKYFSENSKFSVNAEDLLYTFINRLLIAFKKNINDGIPHFTGTPLHIKILAEVFKDEFEKYVINENAEEFDENFDMLDLYDKFIKKKVKIFCDKFGSNSKELHVIYKDYQSLYALKLLFPFHKNSIEKILNNFYKLEKDSIESLQKEGVLTIDENLNISFVHRTFAEYLSAEWLANNLKSENEDIRDTAKTLIGERFTTGYKFLFNIFDRFLTKSFPLHLLIINGQASEADELIKENTVDAITNDTAGRSILHLLALYTIEYPSLINTCSLVIEIFSEDSEIPIDIFGYSPLDYAAVNRSFLVADLICKKWRTCTINIYIDLTFQLIYLSYTVYNYKHLFKILLSYFAYRAVKLRSIDMHETVSTYFARICFFSAPDGYEMKISKILHLENYVNTSNLCHEIVFGSTKSVKNLLISNKKINANDIDGNTPLHYAILHGKLEVIKLLLTSGVDINKENANGLSPLHFAVTYDHFNVVDKLISNKANINAQDKTNGNTPLHIALLGLQTKTVNLLINSGADINISNNDGNTCFHLLVLYGFDNLLIKLLNKGIFCDLRNEQGETPLHLSIEKKKLAVAQLLISNGANVNSENIRGESILYAAFKIDDIVLVRNIFSKGGFILSDENYALLSLAVENSNMEMVREFLNNGGLIDAVDKQKRTVLHHAAKSFNLNLVNIILDFGAHVNACDNDKNTPLHLVIRYFPNNKKNYVFDTSIFSSQLEKEISVTKLLIARGADLNAINFIRKTPLHYIFEKNISKITSAIFKNEIKTSALYLDIQDDLGNTVLHYALKTKDVDCIKKMLNYKMELNKQNSNGNTALHVSCELGLLDIVRLLCERGADGNIKNNVGYTPLHTAVACRNVSILQEFLKQKSLDVNINETDENGKTLLHIAIENISETHKYKYYEMITLILEHNADINICDNNGNTVLHLAVQEELVEIVRILFSYQIDIDIYNNQNKTAQLLAYEGNNAEIINLFQDYCVKLYCTNKST